MRLPCIEAWFLADQKALEKWLEISDSENNNKIIFFENQPEKTKDLPWEQIKLLAKEKNKRGPGNNKSAFANKMINHYGFSIENAAKHPNCPSVKEFHDELIKLAITKSN